MTPISDVSGVGPAILRHLTALGLKSAEDVAAARPDELARATGIGPARAPALISAARVAVGLEGPAPKAPARVPSQRVRVNSVAVKGARNKSAEMPNTSAKKKKTKAAGKKAAKKAAKKAEIKALRKAEEKALRKAEKKAAKKKAEKKARKKALKAAEKKKDKKPAKKAKKSQKRKLCKA